MIRQSFSFSTPNNDWLKIQLESQEFSSKSEVVNDLIRKARGRQSQIEYVRAKLIEAEDSVEKKGWVKKDRHQMLAGFKEELKKNGKI